ELLLKQLLLYPDRHRRPKEVEAAGRQRDEGLDQPLELEEGLVVERDEVELVHREARLRQAIGYGVGGIAAVVLLAREALLLRGGAPFAVADEGRGAVVVEGGYSENVHEAPLSSACFR